MAEYDKVPSRTAALAGATDWHKSTHSGGQNGGCVEVGTAGHLVGVRDTTLGERSPVLTFTDAAWTSFVHELD